jgi:hypothetical protein
MVKAEIKKKEKDKRILKKLQKILWSYDIDSLDLEKDKDYIVTQVLNYGTLEGVKLLYKLYSEEDIREVVKNPKKGLWFKKVLNLWCLWLDVKIKKEVFQKAILDINPK